MKPTRVVMVRPNLENIPSYPLPEGYNIRTYQPGDEQIWAEIEVKVGGFDSIDAALARFSEEFAPHLDEVKRRCLFLEDPIGRVIGTTTAWYNSDFHGEDYGRLHWVAIHPDFQGKGLGKALVSAALHLMAKFHNKAYLVTYDNLKPAIEMYRSFGFEIDRIDN